MSLHVTRSRPEHFFNVYDLQTSVGNELLTAPADTEPYLAASRLKV